MEDSVLVYCLNRLLHLSSLVNRRYKVHQTGLVLKQDYTHLNLAEEEGFEPPEPFRVQRFSRPPVSTTHPFLRSLSYLLQALFPPVSAVSRVSMCSRRRISSAY